jgi:hypothetical protein
MIRDVLTLAAVFGFVALWTGLLVWIADQTGRKP